MFSLNRTGWFGRLRLVAKDQLTAADFAMIAGRFSARPVRVRKTGFVAARRVARTEHVVTHWNGEETANTAEPGDFVATNLSPERKVLRDKAGNANVYVIRAARFPELYEEAGGETEQGPVYQARSVVEALYLPGGFEIIAPWGEVQRADSGYLLKSGDEVYGNAKATFEETYRQI